MRHLRNVGCSGIRGQRKRCEVILGQQFSQVVRRCEAGKGEREPGPHGYPQGTTGKWVCTSGSQDDGIPPEGCGTAHDCAAADARCSVAGRHGGSRSCACSACTAAGTARATGAGGAGGGGRYAAHAASTRAGASFSLPRRLTGEISAGYTTRDYKDPSLTSLSGFVFDSSLAWTATPLTTLTLVAKSAVNELTLPGMAGYLSRDVGLQVDHAFRRYLTATLKAGIGFDTYDSIGRNDQRQLLSAGFIYKATREVHLKGEVRHEWLTSSLPGLNYSADIFTRGVRLQR